MGPLRLDFEATPAGADASRREFRLKRYFSITAGIAVMLVTVLLGGGFYRHELGEEIEAAQARNVAMAQTFGNVIWPRYAEHLGGAFRGAEAVRQDPNTASLDRALREMTRQVPVSKIKVYNLDGVAVYSSVPAEIGQDNRANPGFVAARGGGVMSELVHRGTFSATEGERQNVDVVSSYVPITEEDGRVEAVFELYSDVTGGVASIGRKTWRLTAALVAIFAALYGALLLIVLNADRILQRQYREIKANEEQIQAKNRELDAANRAKSEFLSSTSHELRTPMNAILGFAQLLESEPGAALNANQRRFVQEILKAGRHLLELINEVLDLARIEAGKMALSVEPVHVSAVLAECLPLVQNMARERGIAIELPAADPGLRVNADYMRLKQALLNLLSNAVKYNRPAGRISVAVSPSGEGTLLRIAIADTGPGIPQSQQVHLFQPFHRLGLRPGDVEGTGIGLALTRNLVEAMQGRIGCDSRPGEGSTFWIELPACPPEADAPPAAPAHALAGAGDGHSAQRLLLYIEDNPANVLLMQQISGRLGMRFLSAHNAELGVALAQSARPDLIIMDIHLPGMSGFDALAALRRDPATASIPVMALSANAMPKDVARGVAAGFVRYETKPIEVDAMMRAIGGILEAVA